MKQATLDHEGKHVPMKVIMKGFWLKLLGGTLQTMLENQKQNSWEECVSEGKSQDFCQKSARAYLTKKAGTSRKTQLVFIEGNMCP